eukprot:4081698-Pyramimonas_sp.AAC.1
MSIKAAEVSIMMRFAFHSLSLHGGADVFGAELVGAGHAPMALITGMRNSSTIPAPDEMFKIRVALDSHILCCVAC